MSCLVESNQHTELGLMENEKQIIRRQNVTIQIMKYEITIKRKSIFSNVADTKQWIKY